MYDISYKIVDLQAKCKELKLSYFGKKTVFIKRLNEALSAKINDLNECDEDQLVEVPMRDLNSNEEAININSQEIDDNNDDDDEEEDDVELVGNNGKRRRFVYLKTDEFESYEIA